LKNIKTAYEYLQSRGYTIVSGGTDNHLFVADMRSKGIDGGRIEAVMNEISISINKNTVPGDKSALIPSGIRIGSPAMTTRGCKEADFL
jgi:glycine hydroxymethyltransferase